MKQTMRPLPTILFAACVAVFTSTAHASGSYSARPPRVPEKTEAGAVSEKAKMGLGLRVFDERAKLVTDGDMADQKPRLARLQAMLPADVAAKKDLTKFAGKLTADQVAALEHYVMTRFGQKK